MHNNPLQKIISMTPLGLYQKLLSFYGAQNWWPVTDVGEFAPAYKPRVKLSEEQKFEICVGAILTQNAAWKNVEKAIVNLNKAKMLDCKKMANAKQEKIAELIRPSGYYNQKAKKIKFFCDYLKKNCSCKISKMLSKRIPELRSELLSLHGIGEETADSIVLYSAQKPIFVVDAYTKRLGARFFTKQESSYVDMQRFFQSNLPLDLEIFQGFHALIVEHCKRYCRKIPLCKQCFLKNNCRHFLISK